MEAEGLEGCVGMARPGWRGGGAKEPQRAKKSKITTFAHFAIWAQNVQNAFLRPNPTFPVLGSKMTKIPLRLQAFLHGDPKSQHLVNFN